MNISGQTIERAIPNVVYAADMDLCADWSWGWTTVEAASSFLTAGFTLGSLIYLARYTKTTTDSYNLASRAQQDSVRPVLMLIEVKSADALALAIFKNAGGGIAINVAQELPDGTLSELDSNAVAPDHTLTITLSDSTVPAFLTIRYESLSGDKCCTVSTATQGNRVFNQYFPNASDAKARIKGSGLLVADQAESSVIAAKANAIKKRNS